MDTTMPDFLWLLIIWVYGAFFLAVFLGSLIRAGDQ
jgi:hypothetical protein